MDAKFTRLQNFVNETNNNNNNDNMQTWSRAIFSRDIFQTNLDRVQSFFNKRSDGSLASSSSADDMQTLLQKGDNDPILPALVILFFFSNEQLSKFNYYVCFSKTKKKQ